MDNMVKKNLMFSLIILGASCLYYRKALNESVELKKEATKISKNLYKSAILLKTAESKIIHK